MEHPERPTVQLSGEDGNIYFIVGRARHALKRVGLAKEADEMSKRVKASKSYAAALAVVAEYVEVA